MRSRRHPVVLLSAATAVTLGLTACAGGVGTDQSDSGDGVEFGAGKEEYIAALEDMEPVELTYQAGSASPEGHTGERDALFGKTIEEWSGGKIKVEVLYGQPVAKFDEVTEAVADGSIDLGVEIPIYTPTKYPAINTLIGLSPTAPASPYFSEMVNIAANLDLAWNSPEIRKDYEDKGVTILSPVDFEYSNALMCTSPVTSLEDSAGKQMRVGSAADMTIVKQLGGSPVSLQFTESFEALQRNTIDCTFGGMRIGVDYGFLEVAKHVTFPQHSAFVRNPTGLVAGPKFEQLPLAARQLIFDQAVDRFARQNEVPMLFEKDAVDLVKKSGGSINRLDADAEAKLGEAITELRAEVENSEAVDGEKMAADLDAALRKWEKIAKAEGYEEIEDYEELAKRTGSDPIDVSPLSRRVFEEVYLPHRPGAEQK